MYYQSNQYLLKRKVRTLVVSLHYEVFSVLCTTGINLLQRVATRMESLESCLCHKANLLS